MPVHEWIFFGVENAVAYALASENLSSAENNNMIRVRAPLKVVWCGEHMVPAVGGIVSAIDRYVEVTAEYDETLDDLVLEHTALLECPFPADLCPLRYRVRLTCDEPLGVGLGTSSAILTCVVALTDVWRGHVPLDPTRIFERVRVLEEERSGHGRGVAPCWWGIQEQR